MKTIQDLKLEYKQEFGYYPESTRGYTEWLEDRVLKQMNKDLDQVTSEPDRVD